VQVSRNDAAGKWGGARLKMTPFSTAVEPGRAGALSSMSLKGTVALVAGAMRAWDSTRPANGVILRATPPRSTYSQRHYGSYRLGLSAEVRSARRVRASGKGSLDLTLRDLDCEHGSLILVRRTAQLSQTEESCRRTRSGGLR
jgi:hypothetical protein